MTLGPPVSIFLFKTVFKLFIGGRWGVKRNFPLLQKYLHHSFSEFFNILRYSSSGRGRRNASVEFTQNVAKTFEHIIPHSILIYWDIGHLMNLKHPFRNFIHLDKWNVQNIWTYFYAQLYHQPVSMMNFLVSDFN